MNDRIKARLWFQAPTVPAEPQRDLSAHIHDRERGVRIEFAAWRESNPNFTHNELLEKWKRIRVAWNVSGPAKKKRK